MHRWRPDMPHKGWTHDGVEDIEQPTHVCEMCDQESIRYVHTLWHPEVSQPVYVGCVCAEKLCEDYVNPRRIENAAKARARAATAAPVDAECTRFAAHPGDKPQVWVHGCKVAVGRRLHVRSRAGRLFTLHVAKVLRRKPRKGLALVECEWGR